LRVGSFDAAREEFASHETVKHSAKEYLRGDVHTNSAEGFSIFKRSMRGIHQHCAEKHLHRCLAKYDLHYNHPTRLALTMGHVPPLPSRVLRVSASRTVSLTRSDFKFQAARFMRWRRSPWLWPVFRARLPGIKQRLREVGAAASKTSPGKV
jgi:hypothetical protein